jgi:hypothetical protein
VKKLTSLTLFLIIVISLKGQLSTNTDTVHIENKIARINLGFQGLYFSYEKGLLKYTSLYLDAGLAGTYGYSSAIGSSWAVSPVIAVEGRNYFNYKKRAQKGKNILKMALIF